MEFEREYPAGALAGIQVPSSNATWGAADAEADDQPISQFFETVCAGDVCVLNGSIAAVGPTTNFRIATSLGQKKYRYQFSLPAVIAGHPHAVFVG